MKNFSRLITSLNRSIDAIPRERDVLCQGKPSWVAFHSFLDLWENVFKNFRIAYIVSETSSLSPFQRKLFDDADIKYGQLFNDESQDQKYRKFLWNWTRSKSFKNLTEEQQSLVRFTLSGTMSARWPTYKKNLFNQNLCEQQQLEQQFKINFRRDQKELGVYTQALGDLRSLPISSRKEAAKNASDRGWSGWFFSATQENFNLFKNSAFVPPLIKRQMTLAWSRVGAYGDGILDNRVVLSRLSQLRRQEGAMHGAKTYGSYSWAGNVLSSPQIMKKFLSKKHNELTTVSKSSPRKSTINAYNKLTCSPKEAQELLFTLWNEWLGVTFKETPSPSWAEKSQSFKVYRNNAIIGSLSLDLFLRKNKPDGGLSGFLVDSQHRYKFSNGKNQKPHAFVLMNTSESTWTHNDVLTFFHEMGHALHLFSAKGDSPLSCWDAIESDAVEWPYMFMESWGWDRRCTLSLFGQHGQKICSKIKNHNRQSFLNTGLQVSWIDLAMHSSKRSGDDCTHQWFNLMASKSMHSEALPKSDYARWIHLSMMKGTYVGYLWGDEIGRKVYKKLRYASKQEWNFFWDTVLAPTGSSYVAPLLNEFLEHHSTH